MNNAIVVNIITPSSIRRFHSAVRALGGNYKIVFFSYSDKAGVAEKMKLDAREMIGTSNCIDITFIQVKEESLAEAVAALDMKIAIYLGEDPELVNMDRKQRIEHKAPPKQYFKVSRLICTKCEGIHNETTKPITKELFEILKTSKGLPVSIFGDKYSAIQTDVQGTHRTC